MTEPTSTGITAVVDATRDRTGAGREALLVLADGTMFEGEAIGADPPDGVATGEVVFNTVLTGYQEVISRPVLRRPDHHLHLPAHRQLRRHAADDESRRPFCRGVVVRELARRRSNWRSTEDLDAYLRRHGVPGIGGIDTRRLTRHIRDAGAMPGAFGTADERDAEGRGGRRAGHRRRRPRRHGHHRRAVHRRRRTAPGRRLRLRHQDDDPAPPRRAWPPSRSSRRRTPAADVLARRPDGVFLSNGPGDPATVPYAVDAIRGLLGEVPVFGICLGHQLLAAALGGATVKLPFGHHGGNHPVRRLATARSRSPARTTTSRWPRARCRAPRSPT